MSVAQLISAQDLADRLDEDNLVVLDCRFALTDPNQGRQAYVAGHIGKAYFADLEQDLSAPVIKGVTGRHPLPDPAQLLSFFQRCGIHDNSTVVMYDDDSGAFAARAWWLLLWLGKTEGLYLLDGGFKAWQQAELALSRECPTPAQGQLSLRLNHDLTVDAAALQSLLRQQQVQLLDARALPRFSGEVEPLDPVAGHIPGAVCMPFMDNLDSQGRFLSREALAARFALVAAQPSIAYCGSGVTACHNIFALALSGAPLARLYPGSWSEWVTDPTRAVAKGLD